MSGPKEFIDSILPAAAAAQINTGLPGAVIIAQAIQETGYGKYVTKDKNTGKDSKNLFNIKGTGPAGSVLAKTFEYYDGKRVTVDANFRAYHNYQESFEDYMRLIMNNRRYAPAVAVKDNPAEYARALQQCGYATDPKYAEALTSLMKQWNLEERVKEMVDELKEKDQTPSPWAAPSVEKAKARGVIKGDERGFSPHKPVTREELAVILDRLGLLEPK